MPELSSLKRAIDEIFEAYPNRCLWFSGGNDSRLLLEVMLETEKPFGILRFADGWTKGQSAAIDAITLKHNLQVFTHPAIGHSLIGEGEEVAMVSQYSVDGVGRSAILIRDLVDDPNRCAFDIKLDIAKQRAAVIEFDVHIWGTRSDDTHWVNGTKPLLTTPEWNIGDKIFKAPLAEWSHDDVMRALKTYGVHEPAVETGDVFACHNCLKATSKVFCPKVNAEIEAHKWNREANLAQVRQMLE